jgi:hypothetical protein
MYSKYPEWYSKQFISELHCFNGMLPNVPLRKVDVEFNVSNTEALIQIEQMFENISDEVIECSYKIPIHEPFSVTAVHVLMDDKEIETEIMEKEK